MKKYLMQGVNVLAYLALALVITLGVNDFVFEHKVNIPLIVLSQSEVDNVNGVLMQMRNTILYFASTCNKL